MKLSKAVLLANQAKQPAADRRPVALVCGFSPLHLETFLAAHLRERFPESSIPIRVGVFGDVTGNLERLAGSDAPSAVVLEWQDLDPRLGARSAGGWKASSIASILSEVPQALARLLAALQKAAAHNTVVLAPPSLPLPPLGHTSLAQASPVELQLEDHLSAFVRKAAEIAGVRVVSRQRLDQLSPLAQRYDVKLDLAAGFPYRAEHVDILCSLLAPLLFPPVPKKGLITDLDDTLWKGILGEIGADQVVWDLASHAQPHGLYQQTLAALADQGVLVGCASKNERSEVDKAFSRPDLLLPAASVFPIEAHWSAKSESIGRILKAWNILPSSVVFVDDSPIELAEVQSRYPEITCLLFPRNDAEGVWNLLAQLKDFFGKPVVVEEDLIRAASLRNASTWAPEETGSAASSAFLEQIEAVVTIDTRKDPSDPRPLELVNKTNQFNLNGRRYTESEWRTLLEDPHSFVWTVSYTDKFGPLGNIAVLAGRRAQPAPEVGAWVMSCRAFSRRIEHHVLDRLYAELDAANIRLDYRATEKNKPLQEFLTALVPGIDGSQAPVLEASEFSSRQPGLPHRVVIQK